MVPCSFLGGLCVWSHVPFMGVGGLEDLCSGGLYQGNPRTVKSGWYASYWNACLLILTTVLHLQYLTHLRHIEHQRSSVTDESHTYETPLVERVMHRRVEERLKGSWIIQFSVYIDRVPTRTGKPGKMGRHFPVREKSGNFEQTGKVREKSGKTTQNTGKLR